MIPKKEPDISLTATPTEPAAVKAAERQPDVVCEYCGKKIEQIFIGTGAGMAHPVCYFKAHPPKVAENPHDVLCNGDDTVLGKEIVEVLLTPEQRRDLVATYNRIMARLHARRIALAEDH